MGLRAGQAMHLLLTTKISEIKEFVKNIPERRKALDEQIKQSQQEYEKVISQREFRIITPETTFKAFDDMRDAYAKASININQPAKETTKNTDNFIEIQKKELEQQRNSDQEILDDNMPTFKPFE